MTQWNIKPSQLVEVIWNDPCGASHWVDFESVHKCIRLSVRSVGWVHLVDDYGCVLVASHEVEDDKQLLLRQYLPWGCIQEVWILG